MTLRPRLLSSLLAVIVLAAACGSDTPERGDVLTGLADEVAIPSYERLATDARTLEVSIQALCADPDDATLAQAVEAVADARTAWLQTEALWVGPVMGRRSWAEVDWPIAPDEIEELIADETLELDFDRLGNRIGSDQRGLRAIEYVVGAPDALGALVSSRRCDYLTGISAVIRQETDLLPGDWIDSWEEGGPYRDVLGDEATGGLGDLVNDSLFLLEAMTDAELGKGMGLMGDPPDLDALVDGPLGLGVADLRDRTLGLAGVYGARGDAAGLSPLLSDDLASRLQDQFRTALDALDALDGSLSDAIDDDREGVIEARDALKAVQVTITTEVVASLGVTLGFSDADGDSG